MTERTRPIDYVIVALMVANLIIASFSLFRPRSTAGSPAESAGGVAAVEVSDAQAMALAKTLLALYNSKDTAALYDKFDPLAKAQFTKEQFDGQMSKLYAVIGTVSDPAFSNATLAGNDGGRRYYQLAFKVRLSDGLFSVGDMRLTVTPRGDQLGLIGFFINGLAQPGN